MAGTSSRSGRSYQRGNREAEHVRWPTCDRGAAVIAVRTLLALALLVGGAEAAAPSLPPRPPPAQQIDSAPIVAQGTRKPVTHKPKLPPAPVSPRLQQAPPPSAAPTVSELAALYARIGRQLTSATKRDSSATMDLWPRYRWIRFMDAAKTPAKREAAAAILQRLQVELDALKP